MNDPSDTERRAVKEVKPWHEFLFEDKRLSLGIFFLLLNFVLFIFLVMWQGISYIDSTEERARFGDMFGAVNTLFSGLAFAGIIYTILLQRHELSLQRKELQDTREELQLSRKAHEETSRIMAQQLLLIKATTRIEQAEYRKSMLPHFVLPQIVEQERKGNRAVWVWNYTNIGEDIKDIVILSAGEQDEVGFVSPPSYLKGNKNRGAWSIWAIGEPVGIFKFTMIFRSMDDEVWNLDFKMHFAEGVLKGIHFGTAKEKGRRDIFA